METSSMAVELTVEQTAEALDLSTWTVLRHIREDKEGEKRFPNAHLLHDSRKLGYRIPEGDVLAHAALQGEWLLANARRVIEEARKEQLEEFNRRMEARRRKRGKGPLTNGAAQLVG